jgi:glycosyltransferase involved in cell wall biosynthesis
MEKSKDINMKSASNPSVSIIVPIYNAAQYIPKCIESVLHQSYSDFELLLIDDGSTDNSAKICRKYAAEDNRIVFISKENGGAGSARNLALSLAKGVYTSFVDSDDYIDEKYLEILVNTIKETDSDIVMCNATNEQKSRCSTYEAFFTALLKDEIGSQLWKFLFKSELWHDIQMPDKNGVDDAMVIPYVVVRGKTVAIVAEELYHYNKLNPTSVSNSHANHFKGVIERAIMFIKRDEWIRENMESGTYDEILETVQSKAVGFAIGAMGRYRVNEYSQDDIACIVGYITNNLSPIMSNPKISFGRKIAVLIIRISPRLYYNIRGLWNAE